MQIPTYKPRSQKFLLGKLRDALRQLNLRDWAVELIVGPHLPKGFEDCKGHAGAVLCEPDTLNAQICINPVVCKYDDRDPLWALYHEVGHIWYNDTHDEEVLVNTLGIILCQQTKR